MAEDFARQLPAGYASKEPYPEIKVRKHNRMYADLLMEDYSGAVSELTATLQYMYHSFEFKDKYEGLSDLLEKVAIIEMIHLEVLAEAIIALGGNPVYKSGGLMNKKYWNAEMVDYGRNLCGRLESDLQAEYAAIRHYREHIARIDDPNIQALLKRIILDEEVHVILFKEAIEKYCKEKKK